MKKSNKTQILFMRLITNVILIIINLCFFTLSTYAWFMGTFFTNSNEMSAGLMSVEIITTSDYLRDFLGYTDQEISDLELPTYTRKIDYFGLGPNHTNSTNFVDEDYYLITNTDIPVIKINNIEPGQIYPISFKVLNKGDLAATFSPYFELVEGENLNGLESLEREHNRSLEILSQHPEFDSGQSQEYLESLGMLTDEEYLERRLALNSNVDGDGNYNGKTLEDIVEVYVGTTFDDINPDNYIGTISHILDGDISSFDGYVLPRNVVTYDFDDQDVVFPNNVILCDENGVEYTTIQDVTEIDDYNLLFYMPSSAGVEYEYASITMKVGVTASQVEYEYDGTDFVMYDKKVINKYNDSFLSFTNDSNGGPVNLYLTFKDLPILDPSDGLENWPFLESYSAIRPNREIEDLSNLLSSAPNIDDYNFEYSYDGKNWEDVNILDLTDSSEISNDNAMIIDQYSTIYIRNKYSNETLAGMSFDEDNFFRCFNFYAEEIVEENSEPLQISDYHISVSGNIMYLLDKNGFMNSLSSDNSYAFAGLFQDFRLLKEAEGLYLKPLSLSYACYMQMFANCENIYNTPDLNSLSLEDYCYYGMFANCVNLSSSPSLNANELAPHCYQNMFWGCDNLNAIPLLPSLHLEDSCYKAMFAECNSLSYIPQLPAKELANECYANMFAACTNLSSTTSLDATIIPLKAYSGMFANCKSLRMGPDLIASRIANNCYEGMFYNCTSLMSFGELPSTILKNSCYKQMFKLCSSLTSVASSNGLPARVLVDNCYDSMFEGCSSLINSPTIYFRVDDSVSNLSGCMNNMFKSCSGLKQLDIYFIPNSTYGSTFTTDWLNNAGENVDTPVVNIYTPIQNPENYLDLFNYSTIPSNFSVNYIDN